MVMTTLMRQVQALIQEESKRAGMVYGPIVSIPEGYGVLAEELQELQDEYVQLMGGAADELLRMIRRHQTKEQLLKLTDMRTIALRLASEAIQVAAVCDRCADQINHPDD